MCQQGRRTRLAIDFSTGHTCVSHASGVLGVCVMIISALLRAETERWREESPLLSSSASSKGTTVLTSPKRGGRVRRAKEEAIKTRAATYRRSCARHHLLNM